MTLSLSTFKFGLQSVLPKPDGTREKPDALTGGEENILETAATAKFHFIVMHTGGSCSTSRILNHYRNLLHENK